MKDINRQNKRNRQKKRRVRDSLEASADKPMESYTPQQRRMIRKGLRIMAKVAIRAHLRRNAALSKDDADVEG